MVLEKTSFATEIWKLVLRTAQSGPRTTKLALISLFAVLYTVLRLVPTFPMLGVPGTFSASDMLAPIYGILLGPYIGGASVIVGTFLAIALGKPMIFLGLDFLPAAIGAISLGFLVQRKFSLVTATFLVLLGLYLIHPLTLRFVTLNGQSVPYNWLHIVALAILVSPLSRRAVDWVTVQSSKRLVLGLAILCFIGTLMQHLAGGLIYESVLGSLQNITPQKGWVLFWTGVFFIYPFERLIITVVASLIGSALITTLRSSNVKLINQPSTKGSTTPAEESSNS